MKGPTSPIPSRLRPTMRHIHRKTLCEGALLSEVRFFAERGDRVNLIRADGRRFTIVRNGDRYLVRDHLDAPIATHDTVRECIAAGDAHLDAAEDARLQDEADIGGGDPKGAA